MSHPLAFRDVLHGDIVFPTDGFAELLGDLMRTPEVQRLRSMRLMNFDVPYIQDLATARRLAHSVGAAHLAHVLVKRSFLPLQRAKTIVAAALLHDIGIPPYGHLVETHLRKRWPEFSHESEVRKILYGTYHPTNKYHQILPDASLQLHKVLRRHAIDIDEVLDIISPKSKGLSAVASDIDVDNLDTVHRMATLLGNHAARTNLATVLEHCSLSPEGGLSFTSDALSALRTWQHLRESIYTMIIAHPNFVAYNAFLTDLVRAAVDAEIVTPSNWFLTDAAFEQLLLTNARTAPLAGQLLRGCEYALLEYVWFKSSGAAPVPNWSRFDIELEHALGPVEDARRTRFFWVESGLVSRAIDVHIKRAAPVRIGDSSVSLFVALVARSAAGMSHADRGSWRKTVVEAVGRLLPQWAPTLALPSDYTGDYGDYTDRRRQLEIFGFAS